MIELGGNIKLDGFNDLDPAKLVVVKKLVGNYVRKMHDAVAEFQELSLRLDESADKTSFKLKAVVQFNGHEPIDHEVDNRNLFFGLDEALGTIFKKLK
ncbi:MAG: hypothetical protein AABW49_03550 [Nanoarchaeota archaeon]